MPVHKAGLSPTFHTRTFMPESELLKGKEILLSEIHRRVKKPDRIHPDAQSQVSCQGTHSGNALGKRSPEPGA